MVIADRGDQFARPIELFSGLYSPCASVVFLTWEGELALEMIGDDQRLLGARLRGLAQIHLLLDDRDRALEYVERLLEVPSFYAGGFIAVDPALGALQDDPRFQALLAGQRPKA